MVAPQELGSCSVSLHNVESRASLTLGANQTNWRPSSFLAVKGVTNVVVGSLSVPCCPSTISSIRPVVVINRLDFDA